MKTTPRRARRLFVSTLLVSQLSMLFCTPSLADTPLAGLFRGLRRFGRGVVEKAVEQDHPHGCTHHRVEDLADQIDWLEHHVDVYGSIVPKHPDVWGEARLTRHRQDIELELRKKLSDFAPTLQASLRRSDQAALAMAVALGSASLSGDDGPPSLFGLASAENNTVIERNPSSQIPNVQFANRTSGGQLQIALEPVIENKQLYRYLTALNELRRINEGDDTADSPGYSLNLVRIPVSILPGKRTREAYGAEISFTIRPNLGDELLPQTFRQLAINDQVDQLALPMVRNLERYPPETLGQDPLLSLKAVVRGERLAAPAIDAMQKRIERLTIESSAMPEMHDFVQFVTAHGEYWRRRLIELHTIQVIRMSNGAQQIPPEVSEPSEVTLSDEVIRFLGTEYRIASTAKTSDVLARLPELLDRGAAIVPLTLRFYPLEDGQPTRQPQIDLTLSVVVYEQRPGSNIQLGDLPYRFQWPFGPVGLPACPPAGLPESTVWEDPSCVTVDPWLVELVCCQPADWSTDFGGRVRRAGRQNLREIRKAFEPLQGELIASLAHIDPSEIAHWLGPKTRMPILTDKKAWSDDVTPLLDQMMQRLRHRAMTSGKAPDAESLSSASIFQAIAKQFGRDCRIDSTECSASAAQGRAIRDDDGGQSFLTLVDATRPVPVAVGVSVRQRRAELFNDQARPPYIGGFSDKADQFNNRLTLIGPLFTLSADGPAAPQRGRRSIQPLPPSQFIDVYGAENLLVIADTIERILKTSHPNTGRERLLVDVRRVLRDELSAAYDFISRRHMHLWQFACAELADAIRLNDMPRVRQIRSDYIAGLPPGLRTSPTGALGWCLMVESSLLNERLIDDMNTLASEKGCLCGDVTGQCFWGPEPPPEARKAFNEYVLCRWPIQVFALDPVHDEQNVADAFSSRRELQLAAAIAVATGELNPEAAAQFVRRLEIDLQTIGLNRTQVAFGHGQDTFGWRFYPRVQSPGTPSTLGAFAQTLLGGPGRDSLVRSRQIEPGIRECTAVILMPSFVPYVNFSSRSNWFHLTNPADKELTLNDTMKLSSAYQAVDRFAGGTRDCGCYRPGDVAQLNDVIDRLEKRLPLQAMTVQIPYENALGGFELFHTGTSDLAPQLIGWYGAPGIDPGGVTSLFLVGKGFSVHETRVIVGGRPAEYRLLSREIMEVLVPPGVQPLGDVTKNPRAVDVHVATPYGVSSHLLIPLVERPDPDEKTPLVWDPGMLVTKATITVDANDASNTAAEVNDIALPLGVRIPNSIRADAGTLRVQAVLSDTSSSARVSGSQEIAVRFDAATGRMLGPAGFGGLRAELNGILTAFAQENPSNRVPRLMILVSGALQVGPSGQEVTYPITTALPVAVQLEWR